MKTNIIISFLKSIICCITICYRVGRGENHYQDSTKTSAVPSNISHPIQMRNIDVYKPPQPNYHAGIPTHPQPPPMVLNIIINVYCNFVYTMFYYKFKVSL